jgi:hypothetical protein
MEVVHSSKTFVHIHMLTTWHYVPEDGYIHDAVDLYANRIQWYDSMQDNWIIHAVMKVKSGKQRHFLYKCNFYSICYVALQLLHGR